MWVFVVVKNLHGAKAWTPDILSTGMFFNQIDLSKLVRSTRFYVDFSSLNISQPDHVCWCGWISKQIIDHALKSVEIAPQCLCPARHMSPAMWICSQHTPNMSKRYWAQICGCSVNIVHPSVEVTKRPEQNSGWCGLWSATILDRLFHPWDAHHLILLKMMMIVLGISTNLVRIMWISGDGDLCVCMYVCLYDHLILGGHLNSAERK